MSNKGSLHIFKYIGNRISNKVHYWWYTTMRFLYRNTLSICCRAQRFFHCIWGS